MYVAVKSAVNVGTWNVRGLKVQKRSQTCGRELTHPAKTSLSALSKNWLDGRARHDSGFSYVGTTG
jgi:hypothetical protein